MTAAGFESGVVAALFQTRIVLTNNFSFHYSVSSDGQRFLVDAAVQDSTARPVTVLTNWLAGIRK